MDLVSVPGTGISSLSLTCSSSAEFFTVVTVRTSIGPGSPVAERVSVTCWPKFIKLFFVRNLLIFVIS